MYSNTTGWAMGLCCVGPCFLPVCGIFTRPGPSARPSHGIDVCLCEFVCLSVRLSLASFFGCSVRSECEYIKSFPPTQSSSVTHIS